MRRRTFLLRSGLLVAAAAAAPVLEIDELTRRFWTGWRPMPVAIPNVSDFMWGSNETALDMIQRIDKATGFFTFDSVAGRTMRVDPRDYPRMHLLDEFGIPPVAFKQWVSETVADVQAIYRDLPPDTAYITMPLRA